MFYPFASYAFSAFALVSNTWQASGLSDGIEDRQAITNLYTTVAQPDDCGSFWVDETAGFVRIQIGTNPIETVDVPVSASGILLNLGPFLALNPAAAATGVVMDYGVLTSVLRSTLPVGGRLIAISAYFTGTFTAGSIIFRIRINGAPDSTITLTLPAATSGTTSGTGATVAVADTITVEYDTSGLYDGLVGYWAVDLLFSAET